MGGTSCSTRRSTTSGEATAMAAEISGRILAHDHRYTASGGGAGRCAFAFSHRGARLASFHALRTSLISGLAAADMARNLSLADNRRNESLDQGHPLSITTTPVPAHRSRVGPRRDTEDAVSRGARISQHSV